MGEEGETGRGSAEAGEFVDVEEGVDGYLPYAAGLYDNISDTIAKSKQ